MFGYTVQPGQSRFDGSDTQEQPHQGQVRPHRYTGAALSGIDTTAPIYKSNLIRDRYDRTDIQALSYQGQVQPLQYTGAA